MEAETQAVVWLAIVGNGLLSVMFIAGAAALFSYHERFLSPRLAVFFGIVFLLSGIEHALDAQAFYFGANAAGAGVRLAMVPVAAFLVYKTLKVARDRKSG
jgi:hypothetical protein